MYTFWGERERERERDENAHINNPEEVGNTLMKRDKSCQIHTDTYHIENNLIKARTYCDHTYIYTCIHTYIYVYITALSNTCTYIPYREKPYQNMYIY
jgi:hypothetical protein